MHAPAMPSWMDATYWLDMFGPWALWGAVAIVFAECGLLLGFFLPGDSLLFTVGLLISSGQIHEPLWLACVLLTAAAFAGNVSGYEIGRRTGPAIFSREDSRLFKKEYVDKTVAFFDRYGTRAIVLARFVPVVRTFITVTAGVGRMERRRFLVYSGIGGAAWAIGVTVLGSLLGKLEFVRKNIEFMLLLVVFVSVVPIGVEFLRERARQRREGGGTAAPAAPSAPVRPAAPADPYAWPEPSAQPDPSAQPAAYGQPNPYPQPDPHAQTNPYPRPQQAAPGRTAPGQGDAPWPVPEGGAPWPVPEGGGRDASQHPQQPTRGGGRHATS